MLTCVIFIGSSSLSESTSSWTWTTTIFFSSSTNGMDFVVSVVGVLGDEVGLDVEVGQGVVDVVDVDV